MSERSPFAQDCVDYIYAAIYDAKRCIESCSYIVGLMEKYGAKFSEQDEREICAYVLNQVTDCTNSSKRKMAEPVSIRLQ